MATSIEQLQPLAVSTPAPEFNLPATGGRQVKLSDFRGRNLVIVFYPKDQTPGCTQQLCALRDDLDLFRSLNAEVIAVNPDSVESHERFAKKEGYQFPILVDADRKMARAYNTLKEDGKGINRTVYIVDHEGVIRYSKQGLPSNSELVEAIRSFS